MVDSKIIYEIIDGKQAYETAIHEHVGAQNARNRLANLLLNYIGEIAEALLNYDSMSKELKEKNEMIDALETSLGEADDKIKALTNANVPKGKVGLKL